MKVEIEENLYIESDKLGFQVKKYNGTRFDNKLGEVEISDVLANFSTVNGCAKWIATKHLVKESTATTLHELIEDVERIEKFIDAKINF